MRRDDHHYRRRLRLESLESRICLTADAGVSVDAELATGVVSAASAQAEFLLTIDDVHDLTGRSVGVVLSETNVVVKGSFTEGASLSVFAIDRVYTLGVDASITTNGAGSWELDLSHVELPEGSHRIAAISAQDAHFATATRDLQVTNPPPADVHSALVAHWRMDGDLEDSAMEGVHTDSIEQENATFLLGGLGTHGFHARRDSLLVPPSADINLSAVEEYSIALWFHTRDAEPGIQILYQQGGPTAGIAIYLVDGELYAGAWNQDSGWTGTWLTATPHRAGWNHVGVTMSQLTQTMSLHVNGLVAGSGNAERLPVHEAASIGGSRSSIRFLDPRTESVSIGSPRGFLGWIDDVRVYRRSLTNLDVTALHAERPAKIVSDLPVWENVPRPRYALPTSGRTFEVPATASNAHLQAILDGLQGNDVVILDKDGHWESLVLRNTNPGPKYIISSHMHELPKFGERIDPSYAEWMPTISTQQVDGAPVHPALNSEIGASDYHIAGVRFVKPVITGSSTGVAGDHGNSSIVILNRVPVGGSNGTLPALSQQVLGKTATTYEELGGNMVFDRVIVEGDDLRTTNGFLLSTKDTAIVGSYIHKVITRQIKDASGNVLRSPSESHGIEITDSPGRLLIENNYLSVGSIGVMLGNNGARTTDSSPLGSQIPGLIPPMEDIVIRDNFITKDLAWASEIEAVPGTAAIKNALETKGSNRTLWEDNIIENILPGNQQHGLVVKVSNGQETDNITIRNNIVRQATGGIAISNHLDHLQPGSPSLRVGMVTAYGNQIEVRDMPPAPVDTESIVRLSIEHLPTVATPIEAAVFFENSLRRHVYAERQENGFAFVNNQERQIDRFSFVSNQLDCGEYGGIVGTGLGVDSTTVLDHFTEEYHLEDNVFLGCGAEHNIPDGNTTFAATISLDADISGDGVIAETESDDLIAIRGTVAGDAQPGDVVLISVNDIQFETIVDANLQFEVGIPGADLLADQDSTIQATLTAQDEAGNLIRPMTDVTFVTQQQPSVTIDPITGDDAIDDTEDDVPLTVTGTTAKGDIHQVALSVNGSSYSTLVDPTGEWTVVLSPSNVQAFDAVELVQATASDPFGNILAHSSRSLRYQVKAPPSPIVTITSDGNDDGFLSATEFAMDTDVEVELPANAVAGDLIHLSGGVSRELLLSSADIHRGNIQLSFPTPAEGTNMVVEASLLKPSGARSDIAVDAVLIDTSAPLATLELNPIAGDGVIDFQELLSPIQLAGTLQGDLGNAFTLTLSVGTTTFDLTSSLSGDGSFTLSLDAVLLLLDTDSEIEASLAVWDAAGNRATYMASRGFTLGFS